MEPVKGQGFQPFTLEIFVCKMSFLVNVSFDEFIWFDFLFLWMSEDLSLVPQAHSFTLTHWPLYYLCTFRFIYNYLSSLFISSWLPIRITIQQQGKVQCNVELLFSCKLKYLWFQRDPMSSASMIFYFMEYTSSLSLLQGANDNNANATKAVVRKKLHAMTTWLGWPWRKSRSRHPHASNLVHAFLQM